MSGQIPGDFLSNLSPEELQQLMHLQSLNDQTTDNSDTMAHAQALQQYDPGQHVSPLGAAFGGIARTISAARGAQTAKEAKQERKDLRQQAEDSRMLYARLLRGAQTQPQAQMAGGSMGAVAPAQPMGYAPGQFVGPLQKGTPSPYDGGGY